MKFCMQSVVKTVSLRPHTQTKTPIAAEEREGKLQIQVLRGCILMHSQHLCQCIHSEFLFWFEWVCFVLLYIFLNSLYFPIKQQGERIQFINVKGE